MLLVLLGNASHAQSTQEVEDKLEERSEGWSWLLMQINIKACSKLILLSLVGVTRHADSIQNDYAVSLEYIKDELNDESDFLDADKLFFFACWYYILMGFAGLA